MNQTTSQSMAVIGGGTMGVGIAYVFAVAGWQVYVVEPDAQRSLGMYQTLKDAAAGGLKRGKLTPEQAGHASEGVQRVAAVLQTHEHPHAPVMLEDAARTVSAIIAAKASWSGKRRMLSTRYWYASRSPATAAPRAGITAKE